MNEQIKIPEGTAFSSIGHPVRRKEDARLLTGKGRFTDDFSLDGQTYAAMVRSPHPHARIVRIDTDAAKAMPGVLGGADRRGLRGRRPQADAAFAGAVDQFRHEAHRAGGGEVFIGPHMLLPADKARHVGEAVAMVVAETRAQAMDAAEAVEIEYEELPASPAPTRRLRRARRWCGTRCRTTCWSTRSSATRTRPTAPSPRPLMW